MNRATKRIALSLLALSALAGLAAQPATAQQVKRPMPDENGIDVIAGQPYIRSGSLSIGDPAQGGLEFYRVWNRFNTFSNLDNSISVSGSTVTVKVGESIETFTQSGTTYTSDDGRGSTLVYGSPYPFSTWWTYTLADGTAYVFENPGTLAGASNIKGLLNTITRPNGLVITFQNKYQYFCLRSGTSCVGPSYRYARLQSVTTNTGYQLHLDHLLDFANANPPANSDTYEPLDWQTVKGVTAINNAIEYCDPYANTCSLTQSWPKVTITKTGGTDTWVDSLNQTTTAQIPSGQLASIQSPANSSNDFTLTYNGSGLVASYSRGGGTWNYTYSDVGTQRTTTVTQPLGGSKVYVSDTAQRKLISVTDELTHTTSYTYDSFVRPTRVTKPEGNYTQVTYDGRGNITETRNVAKSGSGLSDIVISANFGTTCSNPKTCNKPNSTTDARGNVTDYSYDSTHGGVLTVTKPAATSGGTRPQTRFGYTALFAYYKNSSGTIVAASTSIYKLTSTSACQTGSSCSGTLDEVKSTIAYGSTGVANNLLPTSVLAGSGDGALTATTAKTYDSIGNVTSIDGPLSGTADTSGFTYDANRRLILSISPDPDGVGVLARRARRYTYNGNGSVTKIEVGTATAINGPFTAVGIERDAAYDSLGRKVKVSIVSDTSTINTLIQYNYDNKGRLSCTAVRMNPSTFASPPSDACTLGTAGSDGDDRISQALYDNANHLTQLKVALGTTVQANERTLTYSDNGVTTSLTDAEGNKTTYEYDGHDRLAKTRYPDTTKGSGTSSTTDYEQLTYENTSSNTRTSGTIASRRLRNGSSIGLSYDALGRVTTKDLPSPESDVTYSYDLLDRNTGVSQNGYNLNFGYDALGRQTIDGQGWGTISRTFDLAGNLTRTTWQDGFYVDYDRLVTGEMTNARENGATSGVGVLASYAYDNLGRRIGATLGNGAAQVYSYDDVGRLQSLTNDLSGTANDLSVTFDYNPASQITQTVRTGNAYAWTGHGNGSTSYTQNGLNQQITVGGTSTTHDANGNLTYEPQSGKTYTYSSENRLTSASSGVSIYYDPVGRIAEYDTSTSSRFMSDGAEVAVEVDGSSNIVRRFVRGDGTDELIAWYEGSGTTNRRFAGLDERGSVISVTDGSGSLIGINAYDEYGKPGSSNIGRMQYTGQMWLSEANVTYSKARNYAPQLGRFLQTDPVGYADSPNLYAYVLADPIGFKDPFGTVMCTGSRIEQTSCLGVAGLYCAGGDCSAFAYTDVSLPREGAVGGSGGLFDPLSAALHACVRADCLGLPTLSRPSPNGAGDFSPLTITEQRVMNDLLSNSGFLWNAAIAFNSTMITGLEHGFFIWNEPNGYRFSTIYGGSSCGTGRGECNMGSDFNRAANHFDQVDPFFATYHVHPGNYEETRYPSCCELFNSDIGFNKLHHSIGIIGSIWDLVSSYGH